MSDSDYRAGAKQAFDHVMSGKNTGAYPAPADDFQRGWNAGLHAAAMAQHPGAGGGPLPPPAPAAPYPSPQGRVSLPYAWPVAGLVLGALFLVAGLALEILPALNGMSFSQANGECHSGLGQFGQMLSGTIAHDCSLVSLGDHAIGWLLFLGAAGIAAGVWGRRRR